ncbi:YqcI/YcgG family protein [Salipaludibacillus sp. CF4.18]|uniref:YqcI/YcgG family protein n=1 Tax=Salipaludibacillus sp. CF4.18 TaxID=3373081 RepID=UPI003EE60572
MTQLFTSCQLESELGLLDDWKQRAYHHFSMKISDNHHSFPCIPAIQGFHLGHFHYGFVEDPRKQTTPEQMASLIKNYGDIPHEKGGLSSLIILFQTPDDLLASYNVEDYEKLFWSLLNKTCEIDEQEWPVNIPIDPSNSKWEFCYDHKPYFVFCGTPAHINRPSRQADVFTLALTPRAVLNSFNESIEKSNKIKNQIRNRLSNYDNAPVHSDLKTYGEDDNHEWKQYFIRDDNTTASECPFHRKNKKDS